MGIDVFVEALTPESIKCKVENSTLWCHRRNKTENIRFSLSAPFDNVISLSDMTTTIKNTTDSEQITLNISLPTNTTIKVLELKALGVSNLSADFFEKFPHLEEVDLRDNNLETMPEPFTLPTKLSKILLQGNKWNCIKDLKWALWLRSKMLVSDLDQLMCYVGSNRAGKPLLTIAEFLESIKKTCTETCECTLSNVVRDPQRGTLEPLVKVNCSDRGFRELPTSFPANTTALHIEGNDIESLRPLRENAVFKKIMDLYVDNNRVSGLEELEGSHWLTHFRIFSLRGNRLSELPTYALDNALQQNENMPNAIRISLGGNPWRCDCVFTPVFQEMLQKYASQVKDLMDIKCSYVEGDENSLLPIIEVSRSSVCRLPTEYSVQEALDLLNAVLASLIVFVLGKLAYDYYHFKKTGRLPWIVTKLP